MKYRLINIISPLLLILLFFPYTAAGIYAQEPSETIENSRLLLLAENSFLSGLEMEENRKNSGREELLRSAALYQTLIEERGITNGKIFYNQGNAYLSAGETGRAVLAYRRALRFSPMNRNLKNNLHQAEEMISNRITPGSGEKIKQIIFFFHYEIPGKVKSLLVIILITIFWIIVIINLFRSGFLKLSLIPLIPALIFGASLLWEAGSEKLHPEVVLTKERTEARKGDASSYAPAFDAPLGGGTTGRRIKDEGEWWQIRLEGGEECWIPASSAEPVSLPKRVRTEELRI